MNLFAVAPLLLQFATGGLDRNPPVLECVDPVTAAVVIREQHVTKAKQLDANGRWEFTFTGGAKVEAQLSPGLTCKVVR